MENVEKGQKNALWRFHRPRETAVGRLHGFSTGRRKRKLSTVFASEIHGKRGKTVQRREGAPIVPSYRRELMLVLISFTVSAKVGLFFICSSTLSREWMTVE